MTIIEELEKIREANDGILLPSEVVEFAKDPETALHSRFTWDDSKAAHEYRLWQAREVIRVLVRVVPGVKSTVRAFVSLAQDRKAGGYRSIEDVMIDPPMRESLLDQAKRELASFRRRYKDLKELAVVFSAMDEIEEAS